MDKQGELKGWQRILLIILPYILIVGVFQLIGGVIAGVDMTELNVQNSSEERLIVQFFAFLGTYLVVWLFMKKVDDEKFIDMGLRFKNSTKSLFTGFSIGALIMFIGFGVLQLLDEIQFQEITFDLNEIFLTIIFFLLVSFAEEIFLRGYVLRNLMYSFNKYTALIVSSAIFSLMHSLNPNVDLLGLTNLFLAGILLGITYIHTKNLWFAIALHFSWNFFQVLLGFNVSGQNWYSLVKFGTTEQTLLNGGAFGFEGSILSSLAMVITIFVIIIYYRKKGHLT